VLPVFNAVGEFGPLMVIFKGIRVQKEWLIGSPVNSSRIKRCLYQQRTFFGIWEEIC